MIRMGLADPECTAGLEPDVVGQEQGDGLPRKVIHELKIDDDPPGQRLLLERMERQQGLERRVVVEFLKLRRDHQNVFENLVLDAAGRVKIIKLGDLLGSRRFFFGNDRLQFQEVSRFFNPALADLDRFAGLAQDEDCQRGANRISSSWCSSTS